MSNNNRRRIKHIAASVLLALTLVPYGLSSKVSSQSVSIAQGYTTNDQSIETGMAVSLNSAKGQTTKDVIRSTIETQDKFVGIVTTKDANLATITAADTNVVVTTSGPALALLTDINGTVKKGDYVTISPLNGILMKADMNQANTVAIALADFSTSKATKQQVTENNGTKHEVNVAFLQVEVKTRIAGTGKSNASFLVRAGSSFTGKTVSAWRVLLAFIIFLTLLIAEGTFIHASIRSTVTSLGRNPLARDALYKQLFQVLLAALFILLFGLGTIYALLQI